MPRSWTPKQRIEQAERMRAVNFARDYHITDEARSHRSIAQSNRFSDKTRHPRWIADRSKIKRQDNRDTPLYKHWRLDVYKRDAFECRMRNKDCVGRIEAHHILPWAQFKNLRFEVNNGITLCHFHHPRKRSEESRLAPYLQLLVNET